MRLILSLMLVPMLAALGAADELVLKDENVVEWKSLLDKGETYEIVTKAGKKLVLKKEDVKEIRITRPESPLAGATFTPITKPSPQAPIIDILKMIDPKKDKLDGTWGWEGSSLSTKHEGVFQQLQLPYTPGDEYDLKVIVERKGLQSFHAYLPTAHKKPIPVLINTSRDRSGIFPIDGTTHPEPGNNETLLEKEVLKPNKPSTIVFMVRKTRILVEIDGATAIDWKIDMSRLGADTSWKPKRPDALAIGAWCDFLVHKVEYVPLTGMGKATR